jgi:hypothetical protein
MEGTVVEEYEEVLWAYLEKRKSDQEKLETESKTGLRSEDNGFGGVCRRNGVRDGVSGSS